VRPEKTRLLVAGEEADNRFSGSVESANFMGVSILYRVVLPSGRLVFVIEPNDGSKPFFGPGQEVRVGWNGNDCLILKG
jgi:hypothetical protein